MFDLSELISLSHYAGERFDLVQAGGGNTSAKTENGHIYVKASGVALGDVKGESDFCLLDWPPLEQFVKATHPGADPRRLESAAANLVKLATRTTNIRPSIEVLMHSLFGPFTLHAHPIAVNTITCRQNWQEVMQKLFPQALLVDYKTPGAPLAVAIHQTAKAADWQPGDRAVVFLENHGIIVTAPTSAAVIEVTDRINATINKQLSLNLEHYRLTNFVSESMRKVTGERRVSFLIEDAILNDILKNNITMLLAEPAVPDKLVYCGVTAVLLNANDKKEASQALLSYVQEHGAPPQVVIVESAGKKYLIAIERSIRKCREVEDVLKSHAMILNAPIRSPIQFLDEEELSYLANWDAEKHRKNL